MKLHILGICGTFMGGVAVLARQCGHQVSGMDQAVYPPMSTQLTRQGISLMEGYDGAWPAVDQVIVGNALSRGNPAVERLLNDGAKYTSGPAWLRDAVLQPRKVIAVAGTHGKTSTASMLAWILDQAGAEPGFLIGGVPENFAVSARLGRGEWFVVEADEYDSAFFDKRSKFVHYRPRVAVLNNLEFDHADIFPDLAAIRRSFHHLVRTVPGKGTLVVNADDENLAKVLEQGCWSQTVGIGRSSQADFTYALEDESGRQFTLLEKGRAVTRVHWDLVGEHNVHNAIAAMAAARQAGVEARAAAQALSSYRGVARRLQFVGEAGGIRIYDDFAHHPTAIAATLKASRGGGLAGQGKLWAALEPRSNSMRAGVHQATLPAALAQADAVVVQSEGLGWDVQPLLGALHGRGIAAQGYAAVLDILLQRLVAGDGVVFMSNGSFGDLPGRLLRALAEP